MKYLVATVALAALTRRLDIWDLWVHEVGLALRVGRVSGYYCIEPHGWGFMVCHRDGEPRQIQTFFPLWGDS